MIEGKFGKGGGEVEKELGIAPDYRNAWMNVLYAAEQYEKGGEGDEFLLDYTLSVLAKKPIEEYNAYFGARDYVHSQDILKESDPAIVAELDKLAQEFNSEREELIRTRNFARITDFARRADALIMRPKVIYSKN
ncbi:MAG: hypothetical protein WC797_02930 [Candidatus Paceibacterota bacterium]|jgi:hypothetical protein